MEINIVKFFQSFSNSFFDKVFIFFTKFGEVVPFLVFFCLIYWLVSRKKAIKYLFLYLSGVSINKGLKALIKRPRPYFEDNTIIDKYGETSFSMPSGHSISATLIFGGQYSATKDKFSKQNKIINLIISCLVVIMVMISRVYLGQHYLSDVIVGALVGIIWLLIGSKLLSFINNKEHILCIITLPIVLIYLLFQGNPFLINADLVNTFIASGLYFGVASGYFIAKKSIPESISKNKFFMFVKITLGTIIVIINYMLIQLIPEILFITFIKYLYMGILITVLIPLLFNLLEKKWIIKGKK